MKKLLTTSIGRLRLYAFLEGTSLLVLIFIAMPLKYLSNDSSFVQMLGPIHGAFFMLFIFGSLSVGVEEQWRFKETTWKLLAACIIPFGTFYVEKKIIRPLSVKQDAASFNK